MDIMKVQKGQVVAKRNDKVKQWYFIEKGSIIQKYAFVELKLKENGIIGILENDRFLCDYIAAEDSVLAVYPCESAEDLHKILSNDSRVRRLFLKAAIEQRQLILQKYAELNTKCRQLHSYVETFYNDYKTICNQCQLEEQPFSKMDYFQSIDMQHKAEDWEINNSNSLVNGYLDEYLNLFEKDDSLCVGEIMDASAQMRRVTQGMSEMVAYLLYNKDLLISESGKDIFQLFFDLAIRAGLNHENLDPIRKEVERIIELINRLKIYDQKLVDNRWNEYQNYHFGSSGLEEAASVGVYSENEDEYDGEESEDCLEHILTYAGFDEMKVDEVRSKIKEYMELPDILSTDGEAYQIRKQLAPIFYDTYFKVFMKAMSDNGQTTPIVDMFLNFGFMDVQMVGEDNANALYDLTEHLDLCNCEHVYTMYEWLRAIYEGRKEPSKNEFDMDYNQFLLEKLKAKKITEAQMKQLRDNRELKVKFEIQNMFTSGNRATYGKISTFCPILGEYDLINSVDKMLVTSERLETVINQIRKVDFSVFYREVLFSDPDKGIHHENIMKEVLPDIILMPNAGTKAMMWQETAGVKRDTPARFMFPILTAVDLEDMMTETMGRYRWEICRKIQGVHWNDIREKSLTAEYCDYIQFYRKNNDLSPDAREKLKNALFRAKNNYREVFVKDYLNWIKYESRGSYRLNKVARQILMRYCPFSKEIRTELKANPMYQELLNRYDIQCAKSMKRILGVYDKYERSGGEITPELKENLLYYQM